MEVNSENDNNNQINLSNIINNQNDSNSQNNESSNIKEYPFQLITKEQEKKDISIINEQEQLKKYLQVITEEENNYHGKKKTLINNILNTQKKPIINKIANSHKSDSKKNSKKKINLNFLSPDVYMRKKMNHTEKNINPIELKLKKIEQEIQNQFDYDYKRVMQQMKDKLGNIKKNKEQEKHIQEEDQKLKEKLKSMEEYRENKIKERAKKVIKKQNKNNKSLKKVKTENKTTTNIETYNNTNNKNNSKNYCKTLESGNNIKLPTISNSMDKYKLIKLKKEKNEKDFITNTKEDILSLEMEHKENYLNHYNKTSKKIKNHNKLYDERNKLYSKYRIEKEKEKNENYLQKDIKRRYNIKLNILRDRSEKSGRLMERIKKNLENFNEKKELLERKEKKKIKEYLKKINKHNSGSKISINTNEKRELYANLQKKNINNAEKEFEEKYNDYLWKQENLKIIAYDMQRVDNDKRQNLYHNSLLMQNENEKKYKSFYEFLNKIEKDSIVNKTENIKLKIYNKKVREENEEKRRKEEEELNK